jgi:restriction system protein
VARKRTSAVEDLLDLVALLPWWADVLLALISYLLLHAIAAQPVVPASQPGQMGAMITQTLWRTLATFGQYCCLADYFPARLSRYFVMRGERGPGLRHLVNAVGG